jgi:hypothetical protein
VSGKRTLTFQGENPVETFRKQLVHQLTEEIAVCIDRFGELGTLADWMSIPVLQAMIVSFRQTNEAAQKTIDSYQEIKDHAKDQQNGEL